jgi:predicted amidohydrolase YtcJ
MGRRPAILIISFVLGYGLFPTPASAESGAPCVVITHVTVIDTHGGPPQTDMTVLVRGSRIDRVEKSKRERWPIATVLDGRGKFLIPGLWDMEVHLSWTTSALPLLVANGITGVRDMGRDFREIEEWITKIASQEYAAD